MIQKVFICDIYKNKMPDAIDMLVPNIICDDSHLIFTCDGNERSGHYRAHYP
jgi:hypothetical protein